MAVEQVIGGVSCGEVLQHLSAYVDGVLEPSIRAQLEEHLRGCTQCARFGTDFSAVLDRLRREKPTDRRGDADAIRRLLASLAMPK